MHTHKHAPTHQYTHLYDEFVCYVWGGDVLVFTTNFIDKSSRETMMEVLKRAAQRKPTTRYLVKGMRSSPNRANKLFEE